MYISRHTWQQERLLRAIAAKGGQELGEAIVVAGVQRARREPPRPLEVPLHMV